ncbi:acyl-CoA desaturase, partial [Streptomyces chartreusis]
MRKQLPQLRHPVPDGLGMDEQRRRHLVPPALVLELVSRGVLLFSFFPPAWLIGTAGLSVAKIMDNMEIGHN